MCSSDLKFRLARRQVYLSLKTPISKVEALMAKLRAIITEGDPDAKTPAEVILKSISGKGCEIMFDFRVKAPNEAVEFQEQQRILLAMAQCAEQEGIQFSMYNDWTDGHHAASGESEAGHEQPSESKSPSAEAE